VIERPANRLFAVLARRTLASDLAGLKRLMESPDPQP
jgi:hypothetical protein